MPKHDTVAIVMLSVFVAILVIFIVVAFATGRAYYGQPMLYVERSKRPMVFWGVVVFMVTVLLQSGSILLAQFSN
jgi:hypothetical protein